MPSPNPACLKAYGIPENKIIIDIEVVDFVFNIEPIINNIIQMVLKDVEKCIIPKRYLIV